MITNKLNGKKKPKRTSIFWPALLIKIKQCNYSYYPKGFIMISIYITNVSNLLAMNYSQTSSFHRRTHLIPSNSNVILVC